MKDVKDFANIILRCGKFTLAGLTYVQMLNSACFTWPMPVIYVFFAFVERSVLPLSS